MNKKKIEKMITHNIESNGDFNKIKDKINYKVYKKEKIRFEDFILSKRVLRLVCPLLALAISIPFIPSFFKTNNTASNQTNMEISNAGSSKENSEGYSNEGVSSIETSASANSASSSSSQCTFYISTIEVYGVIVLISKSISSSVLFFLIEVELIELELEVLVVEVLVVEELILLEVLTLGLQPTNKVNKIVEQINLFFLFIKSSPLCFFII